MLVRTMLGLSVLFVLGGCTFAQDVLRGMEPLLDEAAKFAANSAGEAVKESAKGRWGGGEIAGVTTGAIMSLYGAIKAWGWARRSKPPEA